MESNIKRMKNTSKYKGAEYETETFYRSKMDTVRESAGAIFSLVGAMFLIFLGMSYFGVWDATIKDCSNERAVSAIEIAKQCNTTKCYNEVVEKICSVK
jgi:hypothetical protein